MLQSQRALIIGSEVIGPYMYWGREGEGENQSSIINNLLINIFFHCFLQFMTALDRSLSTNWVLPVYLVPFFCFFACAYLKLICIAIVSSETIAYFIYLLSLSQPVHLQLACHSAIISTQCTSSLSAFISLVRVRRREAIFKKEKDVLFLLVMLSGRVSCKKKKKRSGCGFAQWNIYSIIQCTVDTYVSSTDWLGKLLYWGLPNPEISGFHGTL